MSRLIITRTPLRISFMGGGSDLKEYYDKSGVGKVISTSIDKYVYIAIHKRFDEIIRASYSITENVSNINELNHELIRECLKYFNVLRGIEVVSISDVTSQGTGLGSSSAYTVGLLNALCAYTNKSYSKYNLGKDACKIEIEKCFKPIGKQDQFASAFGGINEITFLPNEEVIINPVNVTSKNIEALNNNLLLFDTNIKRNSTKILTGQKEQYRKNKLASTKEMVELVPCLKYALMNNIDDVGRILNEGWKIKRGVANSITNQEIDSYYELAIANGAEGGKLCGAGGGGFLLLYVKDDKKNMLRSAMKKQNLKELEFNIDNLGSTVL